MSPEPLFDRNEIEQVFRVAQFRRAKFLSDRSAKLTGVALWAALGASAAACLTFFAGHSFLSILN
jgi:hypothetical protein